MHAPHRYARSRIQSISTAAASTSSGGLLVIAWCCTAAGRQHVEGGTHPGLRIWREVAPLE
jgi:hypothetical protein